MICNVCMTCQVFVHEEDWHIDVAILIMSHMQLYTLVPKKTEGELRVTQGKPQPLIIQCGMSENVFSLGLFSQYPIISVTKNDRFISPFRYLYLL